MFLLLVVVAALVGWALHLMQEALDQREFSLMLAGFLVASSAAALMLVYFLMGHWITYLGQDRPQSLSSSSTAVWVQGDFPTKLPWKDGAASDLW